MNKTALTETSKLPTEPDGTLRILSFQSREVLDIFEREKYCEAFSTLISVLNYEDYWKLKYERYEEIL